MTPVMTDARSSLRPASGGSDVNEGWQVDQMIGANPVASLNLALMMGVVVGWLIKRR